MCVCVCVCVCECVCVQCVCAHANSVYNDHHSVRVRRHMPLSQVQPSFAGDGRPVHPTPHLCILVSCLCVVVLYILVSCLCDVVLYSGCCLCVVVLYILVSYLCNVVLYLGEFCV